MSWGVQTVYLALLADLILILHFAFVLVVVVSVPLILIGAWRGWKWIRNRKFRIAHLVMIGTVVAEAILGIFCPLTVWEQKLRENAGKPTYEGSFIAYWIHKVLFYEFQPWVFTVAYVLFGALIVTLYKWIPPGKRN